MSNVIEVVIRATDQASGTVEKFGGAMGKVGGAALAAAVAIGAAAGATVAFTNKMVEGIESVNDAALRLGTTATKLSELHFAADLANVSAEGLNNSLQIMQRTAASAAESGGKVAESLARMGINAKEFSALPVDEKLSKVADKFKNVADAGQRARLANELFGRSGAQMLQMLDQGSDGLARAAEEARKFGVSIGPQQAANAKAYGDMLDRIGAASTGLGRSVAGELIPMITGLGNRFANFIAENREAVANWVRSVVQHFVAFGIIAGQVFDKVREYIARVFEPGGMGKLMTDFLRIIYAAFQQVLVGAIVLAKGITSVLWEGFKAIHPLLMTAFKVTFLAIYDLAAQLGKRLIDVIKGNVPEESLSEMFIGIIGRATEELSQNVQSDLAGVVDAGKTFMSDLGAFTLDTATQIGDGLTDAFDIDFGDAMNQAEQAIASISQFGEVAKESVEQAQEFVPGFWDTMRARADEWLAQHKTVVEEIAGSTFDLMMNTAGAIGDAFGQAIVFGKDLGKSLQNLGKQVLADMIGMLVRIGVQRLILSKIFKVAALSEGSAQLASGVGQVYVNSFASAAAIPVVGWSIAPGIAQANAALAGAQAAAAMATAAGASAAHGGMEYVPSESTYLLQRGERVLSPRQNEDLNSFLEGGQGQQGRSPLNLEIGDSIYEGRAVRDLFRAFVREARLSGVTINGISL